MDLNEPLGITPQRRRLSGLAVTGVIAAVAGCAALCGAAFILLNADPHGGEPYAVATLAPSAPSARPSAVLTLVDPMTTGTIAGGAKVAADTAGRGTPPSGFATAATPRGFEASTVEGGVKVFRGAGVVTPAATTGSGPLVIDVSKALDDPLDREKRARRLAALEPGGKAPAQAAVVPPRVAIFMSGMGLDRAATRTATDTMPAAVALAFVPYGDDVRAAADKAKAKGHEILLQIPMQNAGGMSPGPHALKPAESPAAVKADLAWTTERIAGYDGIANLLGAPVTADAGVMGALADEAGARGLFVLDDGTSRTSQMLSAAGERRVPALKADIVLDATSDPAVVRANLDRLVALARSKGSAIGMATGLPDHMGTIARFAADLDGKGVMLVPLARIARRSDDVAATVGR